MAKLSDLKKLIDEARAKAPAPAVPEVRSPVAARPPSAKRAFGATRHADGDIDLTLAFADVQKLAPSTRARHAPVHPAPIARQRIADDEDALAASKYADEPAPTAWDIGQEQEAEQTFLRRGLPSDILGKLRRGHWSVQSEIDLHGHTVDEAHDALADFIDEARHQGARCVRVIHGKGLSSPNREPVLKGKVRLWLTRWDAVMAYSEAPPHAGGGGAVLILLRGR